MYKISSNIIYDKLCTCAEQFSEINEAQTGFWTGYPTTDNLFTLQSMVQKNIPVNPQVDFMCCTLISKRRSIA